MALKNYINAALSLGRAAKHIYMIPAMAQRPSRKRPYLAPRPGDISITKYLGVKKKEKRTRYNIIPLSPPKLVSY
jgi:hypothetical protein